jgi:hypothetical protein
VILHPFPSKVQSKMAITVPFTPQSTRQVGLVLLTLIVGGVGVSCAQGPHPVSRPVSQASPRPDGFGPPRAAFSACSGRSESVSCAFDDGGRRVTGTCEMRGGPLVCVPADAPPRRPPRGGSGPDHDRVDGDDLAHPALQPRTGLDARPTVPPPEALAACDGMADGHPCTVTTPRETLDGRCRKVGDRMACVPHRAPQLPSLNESR